MPFKVILNKVKELAMRKSELKKRFTNYAEKDPRTDSVNGQIGYSYFDIAILNTTEIDVDIANHLIQQYLGHHFNLLGSGSVSLDYSSKCFGLHEFHYTSHINIEDFDSNGEWLTEIVNVEHLPYSQKLWKIISKTNTSYQPIDWQRDFKSGFRWDAKLLFHQQGPLMANKPGVDLKVPWELSRFQHLPQMALFALKFTEHQNQLVKEFKCELLDFFMANPIGMGVNYNCAMDVGIRIANILVAYDLFKQLDNDKVLDETFDQIVAANIKLQMDFVLNELEYNYGNTSNHYLGNICGLLYGSAYLDNNNKNDAILAFAIQELINASDRQFFDDGGNFEASTFYHRLSGEMMCYTASLVFGLSDSKKQALKTYSNKNWKYKAPLLASDKQVFDNDHILPQRLIDKIYKASHLSHKLTKPDLTIPQFGDNDSGRFFNFYPSGKLIRIKEVQEKYKHLNLFYFKNIKDSDSYFEENHLTHHSFINAGISLFNNESKGLEQSIIQSLSKNTLFPTPKENIDLNALDYLSQEIETLPFSNIQNFKGKNILDELKIEYYPNFQLFIARSTGLHCCMAGISNPNQHPSRGHSHNDKLAVELFLNDSSVLRDPGCYLYTPIPHLRNEFRQTQAHNAPYIEGQEQNTYFEGRSGLFQMKAETKLSPFVISEHSFGFKLTYKGIEQFRVIEFNSDSVCIKDYSNKAFTSNFEQNLYSNAYGQLLLYPKEFTS